MPYIKKEDRRRLYENEASENEFVYPETAGELNYCFTMLAIRYLKQKGENYQHINDIVGALEGAKLELYRRVASPYEDQKIEENGDVY